MNIELTLIDLFSGTGGLTLGFTEVFGHSFIPIWANDCNEYAAATYNLNFGDHSEFSIGSRSLCAYCMIFHFAEKERGKMKSYSCLKIKRRYSCPNRATTNHEN